MADNIEIEDSDEESYLGTDEESETTVDSDDSLVRNNLYTLFIAVISARKLRTEEEKEKKTGSRTCRGGRRSGGIRIWIRRYSTRPDSMHI